MVAPTKSSLAFGSSVKRFGKITVHPNLDPSGLYTIRPDGCDPCLYHPIPLHKIFEVNKNSSINKDPWRYKSELEDWARNLGYRNQSILEYRRWHKSLLGPAWTDVTEYPKYEPACKNVGFGRTPRSKPSKVSYPGPGTYYMAKPYKAPYGPHSTRPSFEREEACRFKDTSPKWSLAPNRYTIIDRECIEQKSKKVVSLKGPYQLFSGKRDNRSIKNHFGCSQRISAATWPLSLPGSFSTYKRSHFGTMNKTGREKPHRGRNTLVDTAMCPRKPTDPGPAHYGFKDRTFKQNYVGFNSSYDKPPGYKRVIVWPGVGRYPKIMGVSCGILGQGHKHVFLSNQQRTMGAILPKPMNSF